MQNKESFASEILSDYKKANKRQWKWFTDTLD